MRFVPADSGLEFGGCHSYVACITVYAWNAVYYVALKFFWYRIFDVCEQLFGGYYVFMCKSYVFVIVFQMLVDFVR